MPEYRALDERFLQLVEFVVETPAQSITGIRAKAKVVRLPCIAGTVEFSDAITASLVEDLIRLGD